MRVFTPCLVVLLGLGLGLPAQAQRRPIGAEKLEKVELPDGDAEADAAKREEDKAKQAEAAKQKAEAEQQRIADEEAKRDAAEAAARKKAEEAKQKAAAEAEAKKAAAAQKKKDDAAKRQQAELKAARAERVLVRSHNGYRIRFTLRPGAPEIKAVEEVRIDVAKKLKVPDPRFGDHKPLRDANLTATVRFVEATADEDPAPKKKRGRQAKVVELPEPMTYRVHSLGDAGLYGFHATLLVPGKYEVKLEGSTPEGERLEAAFDLYPGTWPPPDWETERSRATESTSRRRPITF